MDTLRPPSSGAQPDGRDYTDLAALAVKTVIDLTSDGQAAEKQLVERPA